MICLFGGTFDPVHNGHLHAALTVHRCLATEVRLLLAAVPGHRGRPGASIEQRWQMLELACADQPALVADASEVRRAEGQGRPSYTVETLEALRDAEPDTVLVWVVGSDAYREMESWHRWREVFDLANLLVLERPGASAILPPALAALTRERRLDGPPTATAGGVLLLEAPMLEVSATGIRALLGGANPHQVADLLPPAVYTYIRKYHLYGVVSDP